MKQKGDMMASKETERKDRRGKNREERIGIPATVWESFFRSWAISVNSQTGTNRSV